MDRRNFLKSTSILAGSLLLTKFGLASCAGRAKPRKIPANEK